MLSPGTTIAGYRIDGVLGEGGMGVVYEATQLSLDRKVALKVLSTRLCEDDGFRRRFRREGRLQAAIEHPHIVSVHEAGESDEGLFLAMRLVRGRTLKELIGARPLDVRRTLRILRPIAEALDSAHDAGLIHRDIKPHNILVGAHDDSYLGDFGLTKTPDDPNLTRSGEFLGTPNYIAPEQVRGEPASAAGDVYALGAVLYECLTGEVPFPKTSHAAVLFAHVSAPPPAVTALRPDLPTAIDDVVARAMAKDPAERPATACQLLDEAERALGDPPDLSYVPEPAALAASASDLTVLDRPASAVTSRLVDGTVVPAPEGTVTSPPAPRARRRRRAAPPALAAAGLAIVAAAAAGGYAVSRGEAPQPPAPRTLAAGGLQVTVPGSWERAEPVGGLSRAGLSGVVSAAPAGSDGAGLVAGRADRSGSPLLPAGLRRSVRDVPEPDWVRLAGGDAYRYGRMRLRTVALEVTAYVLPTTRGAAVVACHAPVGARAFGEACERVAGTLRATAGKPVPLGPSARYARRLTAAVAALDRRRMASRRRLRGGSSAAAQAREAGRLAGAFADATRAVRRLQPSAGAEDAHARVRRALGAAADAYRRLQRAAAAEDGDRYRAASAAVRRAESGVQQALGGLRALGYRTA